MTGPKHIRVRTYHFDNAASIVAVEIFSERRGNWYGLRSGFEDPEQAVLWVKERIATEYVLTIEDVQR